MRTKNELLTAMKQNRAERVRLLTLQDSTQLVKLIERLGHFELVDLDIKWLEKNINEKAVA